MSSELTKGTFYTRVIYHAVYEDMSRALWKVTLMTNTNPFVSVSRS